jgi:hypothetical protein
LSLKFSPLGKNPPPPRLLPLFEPQRSIGVCHTDWSEPRNFPSEVKPEGSDTAGFPVILGHEGGGIVESVGDGVVGFAPGDYVIPLYIPECGTCVNCKSGKTNLCGRTDDTQGSGVRLSLFRALYLCDIICMCCWTAPRASVFRRTARPFASSCLWDAPLFPSILCYRNAHWPRSAKTLR